MDSKIMEFNEVEARAKAKELATVLTATTGELALCLHLIAKKRYWETWGFESLDAYSEEELGIKRTALHAYLKGGKLAAEQALSLHQVRSLGVGKLSILETLSEPRMIDRALEFASSHTASELSSYCQTLQKGTASVHDRTVKSWHVKVAADDLEEIQRLTTMIQLEQNSKLAGDGLLVALRHYWKSASSQRAAA
jgi:hypothetical protein